MIRTMPSFPHDGACPIHHRWLLHARLAPWIAPLLESLNRYGQPHDFRLAAKMAAGWEFNTLAKPLHILAALDRNPGKTIIFLDVDCVVRGDLSPFANLHGDIALNITVQKQRGRGIWMRARAGTLVIKANSRARRFIEAWRDQCASATFGEDDETALSRTIIAYGDVTIQQLDRKWRSLAGDKAPDAIIIHDSASRSLPKVRSAVIWISRLMGRRSPAPLTPDPAGSKIQTRMSHASIDPHRQRPQNANSPGDPPRGPIAYPLPTQGTSGSSNTPTPHTDE